MNADQPIWSEENSRSFIDHARYYVPERESQINTLCSLVPDPGEPFEILELACGAGALAGAMLDRYPACTLVGLDGSQVMLQTARQRLAAYGERFRPDLFNLLDQSWRTGQPRYQAVVSSLAIHHLDGPGKARLFQDVFAMLRPGGAFLIADVLLPAGQQSTALAAAAYDDIVRRQALELDGNLQMFEQFECDQWNLFRYPDDAIDHPSTLLDQLKWLEDAGFRQVDAFWLQAGHAIFGGYK